MLKPDTSEQERVVYFMRLLNEVAFDLGRTVTERCENVSEILSRGVGKVSYGCELLATAGDLDMSTAGLSMVAEAQSVHKIFKHQSLGLLKAIEDNWEDA